MYYQSINQSIIKHLKGRSKLFRMVLIVRQIIFHVQKIQDIQNTQIQMKTQIQIQIYKSKQYRPGELRI